MALKDRLVKEIDEISERVRFWYNIILTIITAIGVVIFTLSQGKSINEYFILFFAIITLVSSIIAIRRLENFSKYRKELLDRLEKED